MPQPAVLLLHQRRFGKWWLHSVLRRTLPGFSGALICLSYTAYGPSARYRPAVYRLSADCSAFELHEESWRRAVVLPHRPRGPKRLPTDHRASRFYSPKKWRRREVMLPSGAWPPNPLQTGAGASSGFASESPRGRICTCVDPLRRRRPELLGHAEKMDLAAELPPTTQRSKRRMIVISPREEKVVPSRGLAPRSRASRARVLSLGR